MKYTYLFSTLIAASSLSPAVAHTHAEVNSGFMHSLLHMLPMLEQPLSYLLIALFFAGGLAALIRRKFKASIP